MEIPSTNELITQSKTNVANTLRNLASAIEAGTVSRYEIHQTSDGLITVKADSSDGTKRMIQTQKSIEGYTKTSNEFIQKQPPQIRLETVKKLVLEEKLNQSQIAERTMYSQKTISNDIKKLRNLGEI
ncbi:MAG: HTH domain-containing protein [Methylobacter sp.]|uniref:HTH domain-containing protein n=1 Tax=Candidatus Methylobacter titanis TaxID=3053457 RepID=A0AA43QA53_9GAMM|nr:HTH domain-containing protein [Candidatus Methylobacter titanis]